MLMLITDATVVVQYLHGYSRAQTSILKEASYNYMGDI